MPLRRRVRVPARAAGAIVLLAGNHGAGALLTLPLRDDIL
jgi:hypothetical protein